MNQQQFEDKCKELIPHAPLEDILNLFSEKKKQYKGSKIGLFIQKIKDKRIKSNYTQFLQLGYNIDFSYQNQSVRADFVNSIFNIALKHEREDVIEYIFTSGLVQAMVESIYFSKIVKSPKVLKHILSIKKISKNITAFEYEEMLMHCSMYDKPESFDLICTYNPEEIKQIEDYKKIDILLSSAKYNSQGMLEKLLTNKYPLKFDIEDRKKVPHFIPNKDNKENLLIVAAKNNNIDMIKYLLTSSELEKNADLSNSYEQIIKLDHGKEVIENIILKMDIKITPKLEQLVQDEFLLKLLKSKKLLLKLDHKLPEKNEKLKVKKI